MMEAAHPPPLPAPKPRATAPPTLGVQQKRSFDEMESPSFCYPPKREIDSEKRIPHGIAASRGGRSYMEDYFCALSGASRTVNEALPDLAGASLFMVADGHGGARVAEYLAQHMPAVVSSEVTSNVTELGPQALEAALMKSYARMDAALPQAQTRECGSTACTALVSSNWITVANCGDSRAVLARGGQAVALTEDHAPSRKDEQERIRKSGGLILNHNGLRVMGILSMTRAFGDSMLKKYGLISTPDVSSERISQQDEFLILATDGLWCVVSNQDAVDIAQLCIRRAGQKGAIRDVQLRVAARVLTRVAAKLGSKDNTTVMVVDLKALASQAPLDSCTAPAATPASAGVQLPGTEARQARHLEVAVNESSRYLAHLESSIALSSALQSPPISPGSQAPSSQETGRLSPSSLTCQPVTQVMNKRGQATFEQPDTVSEAEAVAPSPRPQFKGASYQASQVATRVSLRQHKQLADQPMLCSAEGLLICLVPTCLV